MDNNYAGILGYKETNVSEPRLEAVWRLGDLRGVFTEKDDSSISSWRMGVTSLTQVGNWECRVKWCSMFNDFDFLASALVKTWGGDGNRRGSISDRTGIWIGRGMIPEATGIADTGGLCAVIGDSVGFSGEELSFSEKADDWKTDPVTRNFELISETSEAENRLSFPGEYVDRSRLTSISVKKLIL